MNTKPKSLVILGVVVLAIPFLGIPLSWKNWILAILGACIILISLRMFEKNKIEKHYVESNGENEKKNNAMHDVVPHDTHEEVST